MGLQVRPARLHFYPVGNETPTTSRDRIQHAQAEHYRIFARAEAPPPWTPGNAMAATPWSHIDPDPAGNQTSPCLPRLGSGRPCAKSLAADAVVPYSHALLEREPCPCCTPARERAQRRLLLRPAPQVPQRRLPCFVSGPCLACVTSRARSPRPAPPIAGALVPKSCATVV
ncbi:uncharacterized protein LOC119288542 [Triticum dicoccoides]|uniref:uncharacterized protein LOC119288542 n=1 Tax=Triticum dicoccoides TaxID=85692 RepID=UPI00188E6F89|nr:uncharacterized protein LOC119288542 [Triticum dicoccoides]